MRPRAVDQHVEPRMQPQIGLDADPIVIAVGVPAQRQQVLPGADEAVASRTQINTIVANPFANMMLSDRVKARNLLADASSLLVSCGLAMRRFDE